MRMKLDEISTKEKMGEEKKATKKYKFKTDVLDFELKISGTEEDIEVYENYINVEVKNEHQAKVTDEVAE